MLRLIVLLNIMLKSKTITECYTLPEENNIKNYCYTETISEYITDYLLELYLTKCIINHNDFII